MKYFKQTWTINYPLKSLMLLGVLWLVGAGLSSCGLVGSNLGTSGGNNTSSQDSTREPGTFNSPNGRLTSRSTCLDNDDCVELCDSMLKHLYSQTYCYDYTEKEVQALRDTYNLLALGVSRKLSQIEPDDMETFLKFGTDLYRDAIYGFTRGWKDPCKYKPKDPDPTEREDCRLENYYQQEGYRSQSAANALKWIAENNWLAKLLKDNDKDHVIMLALLKILAEGGDHHVPQEVKNHQDYEPDDPCPVSSDDAENELFSPSGKKNICGTSNQKQCSPKENYKKHKATFFSKCLGSKDFDKDSSKNEKLKSFLTIADEANKDNDDLSDSEELGCSLLKNEICQ